ncbi:MAG: hypothetical protein Q9213_006690 [Squamulea squamosa]
MSRISMTIIDRPDGTSDEQSVYPTITGFKPVASYNWLDVPHPTILVPGMHLHDVNLNLGASNTDTSGDEGSPPIWSPPTEPQAIAPDTGFRYVDQNADRYPKSPISPLFSSVLQMQSAYHFSSIDIISDRSPLRKLYAFATRDSNLKEFRFGVSVFGSTKKTVVFHRMEQMTREEYEEGHFRGYRAGFEAQYLHKNEHANGGTSHYRISEYEFGGLKFLVRSGVDGSMPNHDDDPDTMRMRELGIKELGILPGGDDEDSDKGKGKSKAEGSTDNPKESLTIIPSPNTLAPHPNLFELTTRSRFSKHPFDIATKMPDLYLSQTSKFIKAYHHNVGYRSYMREKTTARFALADIHVRSLGEDFKEFETQKGESLGLYLKVLQQILEVVKGKAEGEGKGLWEVKYAGDGGGLKVEEIVEGALVMMREEIGKIFPRAEMGGLTNEKR